MTTATIAQYQENYRIEFDAEDNKFCCMHGIYEMWTTGKSMPRVADFKTLSGAMKFMAQQGIALAAVEVAQESSDADEEAIAIQESIANGDFEIEDLKSTRLGATVSAQFDETNGTLLLATNETQVLLSALETQALACFLHDERDALSEVLHKEVYAK